MNYDQRQALDNTARAVLSEVLALGVATKAFAIVKAPTFDGEAHPRFATVTTPEGLHFELMAPWGEGGKLSACVATREEGALRVTASDVAPWANGQRIASPSATVSASRGAAVVLRELTRRVLANPEAIERAHLVAARLGGQQMQNAELMAQVERFTAMGYTFDRLNGRETHSAQGFTSAQGMPPRIEVDRAGRVSFKAECSAESFAAAVAALNA